MKVRKWRPLLIANTARTTTRYRGQKTWRDAFSFRTTSNSWYSILSRIQLRDRLCGLVVRILGYRSGGLGSIPGTTRKKVVDLERGPLSLVSATEELLDRKLAAPVYKTKNTSVGIRHADHVAPSIRKKLAITSPTSGGRSVGIVRSRTQAMEFS
jgi:hypothetical protein